MVENGQMLGMTTHKNQEIRLEFVGLQSQSTLPQSQLYPSAFCLAVGCVSGVFRVKMVDTPQEHAA